MDGSTSPEPKRARKSAHGNEEEEKEDAPTAPQQQQQEVGSGSGCAGSIPADLAEGAPSRSMTGRVEGTPGREEEDSLFNDPVEEVGEELPRLLGVPPSMSNEAALSCVREHAIQHPRSVRSFIRDKAVELAIASGCRHEEPLVTWKDDQEAAETCGRHQARVLSQVDMQAVLNRQLKLDDDPGYCLARRVRNQIYYDTSKDLLCFGAGNQCRAAPCMVAAMKVFAGNNKDGIPPEVVRAMCKY